MGPDPVRVVLDTNVLLASIGSRSALRWLFDALLDGRFTLLVSTPILLEYEEVIARMTAPAVSDGVLRALMVLPTVEHIVPRFRWRLPPGDADDEKFVDAALAAAADAIVTHDAHFGVFESLDFPTVRVLSAEAFRAALMRDRGFPVPAE